MAATSSASETQVVPSKNLARILRDKKRIKIQSLDDERIYVIDDQEDVMVTRACIIGPKDTPYEDGCYFFKVTFPNNYPYSPPRVTFHTNDRKVRMHPNFYTNGKVCVSIIGTWSGPGWTSCQSLSSVLLTLRSLMTPNPLWEEPGFRGEHSERNDSYNKLISHENIRIAILKMANNTPEGFECFQNIIKTHLSENINSLLERCNERKDLDGKNLVSPNIFGFNCDLNYTDLKSHLQKCLTRLQKNKDPYTEILPTIEKHIPVEFTSFREILLIIKQITELDPIETLTLLSIRGKIVRNVKGEIKKKPPATE
jgi:ubiquitin-conjugating enzyme E2 Z